MTSQQCLREAAVDIREVQRKVGEAPHAEAAPAAATFSGDSVSGG